LLLLLLLPATGALFSVESSKKHRNLACRLPETTEGKTAHKQITKPNSSQLRLTQSNEGQATGYDKTTKKQQQQGQEQKSGRAAAAAAAEEQQTTTKEQKQQARKTKLRTSVVP
jgi:hypothetical protein